MKENNYVSLLFYDNINQLLELKNELKKNNLIKEYKEDIIKLKSENELIIFSKRIDFLKLKKYKKYNRKIIIKYPKTYKEVKKQKNKLRKIKNSQVFTIEDLIIYEVGIMKNEKIVVDEKNIKNKKEISIFHYYEEEQLQDLINKLVEVNLISDFEDGLIKLNSGNELVIFSKDDNLTNVRDYHKKIIIDLNKRSKKQILRIKKIKNSHIVSIEDFISNELSIINNNNIINEIINEELSNREWIVEMEIDADNYKVYKEMSGNYSLK